MLDANDTPLTPDHGVPQLEAGLSHSASLSITIPANKPAGTYYLFAKADATSVVTETNETNNSLIRSIQVGGDLAVSTFTAPAKAGAGASISVSETTINQGAGPVASTATRFYLSANSVWDAGDTLLSGPGTHSVPSLDAGISHTASTTLAIPQNQATGAYYLIAKADGDSQVLESQESNNTSLRGFQIGPDLTVSNLSGPSKGAAGVAFVVTDTTTNQGGGNAAGSTVEFYLSADWIFDAGDSSLNVSRSIPRARRWRHVVGADDADDSGRNALWRVLRHREGRSAERHPGDAGRQQHRVVLDANRTRPLGQELLDDAHEGRRRRHGDRQ